MPKTYSLSILMLLFTLLLTLSMSLRTYAYGTATVYVDPPESTGLTVGQNFLINVNIADVSNLAGYGFRLYFLSRVINVIDAQEGPFLSSVRSTIFVPANVTNYYNATHGLVYLACALLGSGDGAYGSGTLARINFTVVGVGQAPLHLSPNQTRLLDSTPGDPQLIPHTTVDGYVRVGGNDIAVTDVKLSKTFTSDTNVQINVTVRNYGNYSTTFDVTLYYNENEIQTQAVIDLPPDNIRIVNFIWDTTPIPKGNYTIKAYAHPVTGETILENNILIGGYIVETIKGDVTGDYKVDIYDIYQFARAFGSTPRDPQWNPNCDLIDDGQINIQDIYYAARNYGKQI